MGRRHETIMSKNMNRRGFLHACLGAATSLPFGETAYAAKLPKTKITRIRYYRTPTDAAGRPNTWQPPTRAPCRSGETDSASLVEKAALGIP
jgi:hypothetical protein